MGRVGNGSQDIGEPWEDSAGMEEERWDKGWQQGSRARRTTGSGRC